MYFLRILMITTSALLLLPALEARRFRVVQLPNQEQLPVANVHRILQDSEGYMWYATEGGGLCRDDGYRVEVFRSDKNRPSLLPGNDITCLTEDKQGRIWFGTTKGACLLDKKGYGIDRLQEEGVRDKAISSMFTATDGTVWIAAQNRIFGYRLSENSDSITTERKAAAGSFRVHVYVSAWKGKRCPVVNFFETADGRLLAVQGGGGLLCFDRSADGWLPMEWPLAYAPNYVVPASADSAWWVATWGQGIVKYRSGSDGKPPVVIPQPATLGPDGAGGFRSQVLNVLYDSASRLLWVAAMDDLYAYRIKGDTLVPYATDHFLSKGKKILDNVVQDNKGNIWVPGYSPHTFIVQAVEAGLRRDSVKAMSDKTGYRVMVDRIVRETGTCYWIWQGRTGLSFYDAEKGKMSFAGQAAVPGPLHTAKCVEKSKTGPGIWTCSGKRLFRVWNHGMEIHWKEEKEASLAEAIRVLRDDGRGSLLIGTDNAVYAYDYTDKRLRLLADSLGRVRDVVVSADGTVYGVADKAGFCRVDASRSGAVSFSGVRKSLLPSGGFCSLTVAPDGRIWIATSGGNVCCYDPAGDRWREDEKAGNPNGDAVKKIVADKQGHLWILTDKYIKEYNPENAAYRLLRCSDPAVDMDYFHTVSLEGDSLCLGGIGAFCMLAPSAHLVDTGTRPVPTLLIVDGVRRLPSPGPCLLTSRQTVKRVEVFVSTFDYLYADSIRFAWRLGADAEWTVLPKGSNRILLEDIPDGTAVLEVKATDRQGEWGRPVRCVTFRSPALWSFAALWVIGGSLIVLIVIAYALYKRKKTSAVRFSVAGSGKSVPRAGDGPEEPDVPSADEDFLRKAVETVERNLDNAAYSVEQFSSDLCMSRMNLYRKLQALTSSKPSEFIRDIRLQKAAALLVSSNASIAEIVDRVGFGTSRYFSKCFKEKYGVTPSQYRAGTTGKPPESDKRAEQM